MTRVGLRAKVKALDGQKTVGALWLHFPHHTEHIMLKSQSQYHVDANIVSFMCQSGVI
jgi:hypothetical protein